MVLAAGCALAVHPSAHAAQTVLAVKPLNVNQALQQSEDTDRIVVRYKSASLSSASKLSAVTGAAIRAGILQPATRAVAGAASSTTLTARRLRTLSIGGEVIQLSRQISPAEQTTLLTKLRADSTVETAYVSHRAYAQASDPNDAYWGNYEWTLKSGAGGVNAPAAWDTTKGAGVIVAVLDTGILPLHPDHPVNLLEGYDFISDAEVSGRATDDRVAGAIDQGDWTTDEQCTTGWKGQQSSWHGTHVAGTIAEATNNTIGMAGLAPDATILPVRVLGHCGGYEDDIADAIVWASGGHVEGVPDNQNPAEIINMSLGGGGACTERPLYQAAIDAAVANGTLVVVAAGNNAADTKNYSPSSCNNVVTVASTGYSGQMSSSYTNYGTLVDVAAPGGAVTEGNPNGYVWQQGYNGTTTNTSGGYTYMGMAGTSQATPHVSASAALVQAALIAAGKAPLTPADLETLLKKTARAFPIAPSSSTPIGSGIVDPVAAIQSALSGGDTCDSDSADCETGVTPVENKVNLVNLSGTSGSETVYSFKATAGAALSVITLGGTGNVDVYVSYGKTPSTSVYDAKSARAGNNETVRIATPVAGTYYIKLVGASQYAGVTLSVRQ
ncbi:S8 family peptidase [Pseudoxanthomonas sp. GM95]|uniref:S8 family peptidase n=1 Tax=Pseudoxanthomonas sp. GM95 TaxID=1881043 RepID=UPI000B8566E2|nr:S8 family peptidase [Pseudoxanthomonas sp. GM95]